MGYPRIIANSKDKKRLPATRTLFQALKCHDVVFIDFVERCLCWDPAKRMTPQEALQHEWITQSRNNTPQPIPSFLSSAALQRKSSMR
jgi:serine/threonine protein kinase